MTALRALDLFCGAGGATRGLQLAGFRVTGVDIASQPRYVGEEFHQADALEFPLEGYDLIWASPPCQAYTQMSARWRKLAGGRANSHPDLISPVRDRLIAWGGPYIIENVVGAKRKMRAPITLSGASFGLRVHRPRLFESNLALLMPSRQGAPGDHIGVYGDRPDGRRLWTRTRLNGDGLTRSHYRAARSTEDARDAMGIDWMEWRELAEGHTAGVLPLPRAAGTRRPGRGSMTALRARILALVEYGPITARLAYRILAREGWSARQVHTTRTRLRRRGLVSAVGRTVKAEWVAGGVPERGRRARVWRQSAHPELLAQTVAGDRVSTPPTPALLGPCAHCGNATTARAGGVRCCHRAICREGVCA